MSLKPTPKERPFKKFFCDRPEVFLLPPAALKVWLYHYSREGHVRQSWPGIETLCEKLNMDRHSVCKWRGWLITNGWLEKIGEREGSGKFSIPVFKVKRGSVPASNRDGRSANRVRKHCTRLTGAKTLHADRCEKIALEVDSEKQVDVVSEKAATAVSESQMEKELQRVWDYYLDAFKKDEIISPSKKKMGLEVISKLRPDVNRVEVMAGAIDMAHHIVKHHPEKSYLAKWTSIFAKFSTFLSLYEESRDSKIPTAASLSE
jgi:hypothetical protein